MPRPSWGSRALASGLAAIFFAGGILHLGSMLPAAPYPVTAATQDVTRTIERESFGAVPEKRGAEGLDGRLMQVAVAALDGKSDQGPALARQDGLGMRDGAVQVVIEAVP